MENQQSRAALFVGSYPWRIFVYPYGNNDSCILLYLDTMQSHNHKSGTYFHKLFPFKNLHACSPANIKRTVLLCCEQVLYGWSMWKQIEASRDMALINMSPINIVELLMDVNQWSKAFYNIVSKATILGSFSDSNGVEGCYDGKLHLMNEEFHLPSPVVPTRECSFARYFKQFPENKWVVVDLSLENFFPSPSNNFRKRPSGCFIIGMPDGSSKIIVWNTSKWERLIDRNLPVHGQDVPEKLSETQIQFHPNQQNFLVVHNHHLGVYEAMELKCVNKIIVWNTSKWERLIDRNLPVHGQDVPEKLSETQIQFHPNQQNFLVVLIIILEFMKQWN